MMPLDRRGSRRYFRRQMSGVLHPITRSSRQSRMLRILMKQRDDLQSSLDEAQSKLTQLSLEVDETRNESDEIKALALRLKSDLIRAQDDAKRNKRLSEEREEQAAERARLEVSQHVMRVSDEFAKALEFAKEQQLDAKWLEGFNSMYEKVNRGLEDIGYRRFESLGEDMDPTRHEALATMPTSDDQVGKVVEVVEAGYEDAKTSKVVRVAKVLVGKSGD